VISIVPAKRRSISIFLLRGTIDIGLKSFYLFVSVTAANNDGKGKESEHPAENEADNRSDHSSIA
jgi:hypothetical protein